MSFGRLGTFGTGFGRLGHAPRTPWWLSGSSLDMDFAKNRARQAGRFYMPSALLTTTRASDAYADDSTGRWSLFSSGVPRITDRGLLVEESRTNSTRNNSGQGAVAGTPGTNPANVSNSAPGTLTKSVVSADSQNGIDYWDIRLVGTTSNTSFNINLDGAAIIAASNGQTWTNSAFLAAVAGGFANITGIAVRMAIYDAGVVYLGEVGSPTVLNSLPSSLDTTSRKTTTGTIANASTALISPYLQFTWASGVAIDITLRIGWPQLELGGFVTSPIRTTSAAATRAADAITMTIPALPSAYTLFGQATALNGVQTSGTPTLMQVDDGTLNNRALIARTILSQAGAIVLSGGVAQAAPGNTAWSNAARGKTALAVALDDFAFVFNGGSPATDASGSIPAGSLTTLRIGSNTAAYFGGTIERIAIFPTRLTNAQLQAITQ